MSKLGNLSAVLDNEPTFSSVILEFEFNGRQEFVSTVIDGNVLISRTTLSFSPAIGEVELLPKDAIGTESSASPTIDSYELLNSPAINSARTPNVLVSSMSLYNQPFFGNGTVFIDNSTAKLSSLLGNLVGGRDGVLSGKIRILKANRVFQTTSTNVFELAQLQATRDRYPIIKAAKILEKIFAHHLVRQSSGETFSTDLRTIFKGLNSNPEFISLISKITTTGFINTFNTNSARNILPLKSITEIAGTLSKTSREISAGRHNKTKVDSSIEKTFLRPLSSELGIRTLRVTRGTLDVSNATTLESVLKGPLSRSETKAASNIKNTLKSPKISITEINTTFIKGTIEKNTAKVLSLVAKGPKQDSELSFVTDLTNLYIKAPFLLDSIVTSKPEIAGFVNRNFLLKTNSLPIISPVKTSNVSMRSVDLAFRGAVFIRDTALQILAARSTRPISNNFSKINVNETKIKIINAIRVNPVLINERSINFIRSAFYNKSIAISLYENKAIKQTLDITMVLSNLRKGRAINSSINLIAPVSKYFTTARVSPVNAKEKALKLFNAIRTSPVAITSKPIAGGYHTLSSTAKTVIAKKTTKGIFEDIGVTVEKPLKYFIAGKYNKVSLNAENILRGPLIFPHRVSSFSFQQKHFIAGKNNKVYVDANTISKHTVSAKKSVANTVSQSLQGRNAVLRMSTASNEQRKFHLQLIRDFYVPPIRFEPYIAPVLVSPYVPPVLATISNKSGGSAQFSSATTPYNVNNFHFWNNGRDDSASYYANNDNSLAAKWQNHSYRLVSGNLGNLPQLEVYDQNGNRMQAMTANATPAFYNNNPTTYAYGISYYFRSENDPFNNTYRYSPHYVRVDFRVLYSNYNADRWKNLVGFVAESNGDHVQGYPSNMFSPTTGSWTIISAGTSSYNTVDPSLINTSNYVAIEHNNQPLQFSIKWSTIRPGSNPLYLGFYYGQHFYSGSYADYTSLEATYNGGINLQTTSTDVLVPEVPAVYTAAIPEVPFFAGVPGRASAVSMNSENKAKKDKAAKFSLSKVSSQAISGRVASDITSIKTFQSKASVLGKTSQIRFDQHISKKVIRPITPSIINFNSNQIIEARIKTSLASSFSFQKKDTASIQNSLLEAIELRSTRPNPTKNFSTQVMDKIIKGNVNNELANTISTFAMSHNIKFVLERPDNRAEGKVEIKHDRLFFTQSFRNRLFINLTVDVVPLRYVPLDSNTRIQLTQIINYTKGSIKENLKVSSNPAYLFKMPKISKVITKSYGSTCLLHTRRF